MLTRAGDSNGTKFPMGEIVFLARRGRRGGEWERVGASGSEWHRVGSCYVLVQISQRAPLMLARPCPMPVHRKIKVQKCSDLGGAC